MINPRDGVAAALKTIVALVLGRPFVMVDPTWPAERREAGLAALPTEFSPPAPFYIGFTSGSSGAPKPFARTEQSWAESFAVDRRLNGFCETDIVAIPGALHHSLPLYGLLSALAAGAEALLAPERGKVRDVAAAMRRRSATVVTAAPAQLLQIARAVRVQGGGLTRVRLVLCGGAALPEGMRAEIAAAFPNAEIRCYYGASELSYVAIWRAEDAPPHGSVGKPVPGVAVRVMRDDGAEAAAGEVGRVVVRSPFAALGYLAPAGVEPLPQLAGGVALGDLGYLDPQGFLFIVGRADRVLNIAGRNVSPEPIEAALLEHPGVSEAAVVGEADPVRGARLAAIISVAGAPPRKADLIALCRSRLGPAESPGRFYLAAEWPRLASGKTDHAALALGLQAGLWEAAP
ncbi:MAG: AMP-binding protein [Neomegalonema sp.]|nr:AMP-binding protein [Neomegalonema sp.]